MSVAFGNSLSKTHLDAAGDDPAQARSELEAVIDRLNNKLVNVTILTAADTTGNDAGIVSGTAGTDGNLVQWNADGDVVDGPDVLDEDDMASDSDSAVPTQQSVRAYTDAGDPTLGTIVDATNGGADNLTEIDFTGIKAGADRITVIFNAISLSGTNGYLVQIGDSEGFETSSYASTGGSFASSGQDAASSTSGFIIHGGSAAQFVSGHMVLTRISSNRWIASYSARKSDSTVSNGGGSKSLTAELDRIRITSSSSDTFDNGTVNIMVE